MALTAEQVAEIFDLPVPSFATPPRYNVAPTQFVPVIAGEVKPSLMLARWGLVPPWSKDLSIGSKMINARAETLSNKKSFRDALLNRRCLVPADGFYEWQREGKIKQPYRITLPGKQPFALAGLWERWMPPEGDMLVTFTIITTEASDMVRGLHHRMPVILANRKEQLDWLRMGASEGVLAPYESELSISPVSTRVNSPQNDDDTCIEPLLHLFS